MARGAAPLPAPRRGNSALIYGRERGGTSRPAANGSPAGGARSGGPGSRRVPCPRPAAQGRRGAADGQPPRALPGPTPPGTGPLAPGSPEPLAGSLEGGWASAFPLPELPSRGSSAPSPCPAAGQAPGRSHGSPRSPGEQPGARRAAQAPPGCPHPEGGVAAPHST